MNYTHDNVLVSYEQLCRQSPILAQFVFAKTLVGGAHDVSALIRAGGDVNGTDSDGTPHLITAFAHHKFQAARALIEGGADVDVVDSGLNSALILSVRYQARACPERPLPSTGVS